MLDFARWLLFPVACLGCGRPDVALCSACAPASDAGTTIDLDEFSVRALGPYEGLWRRAIVAFKAGEQAYADAFAALLRARFPLDCTIVPVTTTRRRAAARGFDQAVELAQRYAPGRTIDALRKGRGPAQHGLRRIARLALSGRFWVHDPHRVAGKRIVLLDDVCTTGATLLDAARALRAAGGEVAGGLVLAAAKRF